jgi:hypothetical protein
MVDELTAMELLAITELMQMTAVTEKVMEEEVAAVTVTDAKTTLKQVDDEMTSHLMMQMLATNTAEKGFILWMKPSSIGKPVNPKLLNLKETLHFLLTSSGSYSYELFDKSDQFQFDFIQKLRLERRLYDVPDYNCLDLIKLQAVYDSHFPGVVRVTELSSTKDIIATAKQVFTDLDTQAITISDSDGKILCAPV